jgi:hypothetical protein
VTAGPKPTPRPGSEVAEPAPAGSDQTAPATPKHAAEPSIGQLVSEASTHLSALMHSEIELAKLELRASVKNAGTGAGLFAAAGALLVFSLTFGFFALAEGLNAAGLDRWVAFLIVFGFQLVLVALCAFLGIKKVKRVRAPERTLTTTRETVDYLKKSRG